jgi:hypothetical protein
MSSIVVWQGWQLQLPSRWSPVRLEGTYDHVMALFADLHRPRLGLRWHRPRGRKFSAEAWAKKAMLAEVGQLAAAESREHSLPEGNWNGSRLYIEPEPPGRDVWVAQSGISSRAVEIIHHAHRREHVLVEKVLPTLVDQSADRPMPWAIFDLSCIVPSDLPLLSQQLNVGDRSLTFGKDRRRWLMVRQVAAAKDLALRRMPIEKWLLNQQRTREKHYKIVGVQEELEIDAGGRMLKGLSGAMIRRTRFAFMRWIAEFVFTAVLHDTTRDRLVLMQGTDEELVQAVAQTVGWAHAAAGASEDEE